VLSVHEFLQDLKFLLLLIIGINNMNNRHSIHAQIGNQGFPDLLPSLFIRNFADEKVTSLLIVLKKIKLLH